MRTDVEKAPLKEKIEAVFNPSNIDDDCDKIAGLLAPNKVQIGELLDKREYHEAFTLFYEILESLSYHFIKDERYCHFDDMYSPDYTCGDMLDAIVKKVKDGVVAESDLKYLAETMDQVFQQSAAKEFFEYLKKYYPNGHYLVVYESGFSISFTYYALQEYDIACMIVHVADAPTTQYENVMKSDLVGSQKLVKALKENFTKYLYSLEGYSGRLVVRIRKTFQMQLGSYKACAKHQLYTNGIMLPDCFSSPIS